MWKSERGGGGLRVGETPWTRELELLMQMCLGDIIFCEMLRIMFWIYSGGGCGGVCVFEGGKGVAEWVYH